MSSSPTYAWAVGNGVPSESDWRKIQPQLEQFGAKVVAPKYLNTRALIEYRCGNYSAAIKFCDQGLNKSMKTNVPLDWIIKGMCYAKQSKLEAARQVRARVSEWSANKSS